MTGEVSSWLVCLHHADSAPCCLGATLPGGVHLFNVLPLKTHNIASAVLLLRAGKNLPGFKERGYVVRNSSVRCSMS